MITILVSPGQDKFNTSPSFPSTVYSARVGVRLANGLWRTILYWDKLEGTMVIMVTMVTMIIMVILYWERVGGTSNANTKLFTDFIAITFSKPVGELSHKM